MNTKSKVIIGLVAAAAAGAAIGLLLAPEKGADTRKLISKKATGIADQLTDIFANAKGELQRLRNRGVSAANDIASTAADGLDNLKENYS